MVVVKENNDKVYLWIEAEAGKIIDPMLAHDAEKASGGQYIGKVGAPDHFTPEYTDNEVPQLSH